MKKKGIKFINFEITVVDLLYLKKVKYIFKKHENEIK